MRNNLFEFINSHNIYNKEVYNYYIQHSHRFDYYDEDFLRNCISCNCLVNNWGFLKEIKPFVPFVVDDITTLININQYMHTLLAYDMLNKKFILGDDCEILPIFYEKLFVSENGNEYLNRYEHFQDMAALESNNKRYLLAIMMFDKLFNNYQNNNISDMKKKVRILIKKY